MRKPVHQFLALFTPSHHIDGYCTCGWVSPEDRHFVSLERSAQHWWDYHASLHMEDERADIEQ